MLKPAIKLIRTAGMSSSETAGFTRRLLIAVAVVTALLIIGLVLWRAVQVFLVVFAGILVGVLLDGSARKLSQVTPLNRGLALALIALLIPAALTGFGFLAGPSLAEQTDELGTQIPEAVQNVRASVMDYQWGQWLTEQVLRPQEFPSNSDLVGRITGFFSTTLAAVTNFFLILVIGLFLASEPSLYVRGVLHLFPQPTQRRARNVLHSLGRALRWWFAGQLAAMGVVGILTTVGLLIMGVPLALILGVIAALLAFIPNLGPLLSLLPAVMVGLMQSPMTALYVILLYAGVQAVESNLITPIIQEHAVSLPPALLLSVQILFGYLMGLLGLLLATPLLVVVVVLVQMLYVQGVINEPVPELGSQ